LAIAFRILEMRGEKRLPMMHRAGWQATAQSHSSRECNGAECSTACQQKKESNVTERQRGPTLVHISAAPSVHDADGVLRRQCTDLNRIIASLDEAEGRNDALIAYIFALRDLQHANDAYALTGESSGDDVARAEIAVKEAFAELAAAQHRPGGVER
jgi:hypothetical protein